MEIALFVLCIILFVTMIVVIVAFIGDEYTNSWSVPNWFAGLSLLIIFWVAIAVITLNIVQFGIWAVQQ